MSLRSRSRNAYESQLNGGIASGTTSFAVDSGAGLAHPVYLVIAPLDSLKREYIKVGNVSGNTLSSVTRGLDGSAAGAQDHDSGTPVRAVPVHQWLDDIFTDIESLEAADAGHIGGTDTADHPEATTGVRGFMSAADKVKLNALDTTKQVTGGDTHDHIGGDGAAIVGLVTNGNAHDHVGGDGAAIVGIVTGGDAHDHAGGDGAQIAHSGLSGLTTGDPHTQYLKEEASGGTAAEVPDHTHASGAQAGTVAHSDLTGLTAGDPHTQYMLEANGYGLGVTPGPQVIFTGNGTFTKADYPGLRAIIVEMVGGGGQGGGADTTGADQWSAGVGGHGAGWARSTVLVADLAANEAVTVGAGGTGAVGANNGNAGGDSIFDTISGEVRAVGGGGGGGTAAQGGTLFFSRSNNGAPGGGTGDLVIVGGYGLPGINVSTPTTPVGEGGWGGASHLSNVTRNTITVNQPGSPGALYGGGGSGGHNSESQGTARAGGDGAAGIVIVTLLF